MKTRVIAMTLSTACAVFFTTLAYFQHSFAIEMTAMYFIVCTFVLAIMNERQKSKR